MTLCLDRTASKSKAADESDAELAGTSGVVDSMDDVGLDESEPVCWDAILVDLVMLLKERLDEFVGNELE